jgi:Xaa-Pro aminopeptidase/Xaa-Pro dipeptidase
MIKDQDELANLQKACDITNQVFEAVLEYAKPGISEKDLAIFVNKKFLDFGADKLSFDTIVASGVNGSKPHAVPTDKKLVAGELVTLDMGCFYNGYASDQTRTFQLGQELNPQLTKIYQTVYDAQSLGISMVKPGIEAKKIHQAVAKYIAEQGFEGYFNHGLGHGYGLEIHEEPYVSVAGNEILKPGMTITIEPGIYIPQLGGVRIEDDLVVTENGYQILTSSIRELQKI